MKQRFLTLLLLIATISAAEAIPVDMGTAREVAMKFLNANAKVNHLGTEDLQLVTTYSISRGIAAFHIFNTPNGFVIVAADDCATPVLGYSDEGRFDVENIPIQLQNYLQGLVEQIEYGIESNLDAGKETLRQWELVRRTGRLKEDRDGGVVEPLVTAMWNQGCYYNAKCPEDPNGYCGGRVPTGCAATAMGMIMHYWGYPSQGSGTHAYVPVGYPEQSVNFSETTYDWTNMPDQLSETSSQEEIDAVSTLLWHCGVSVNTRYGALVSTVFAELIPGALVEYFNYSNEIYFPTDLIYDENLPLWLAMIKNDLFLGRPILYLGVNPDDGHAWVCDGIDSQDLLHFNWGWGGQNNGYFSLYTGIGYVMQSAIFNIVPDGNPGVTTQVTTLVHGWNWSSLSLEVDDPIAALQMLEEALGENGLHIESDGLGTEYLGDGLWIGDLEYEGLTNEQMFLIEVSTDCTVELQGIPVNPASHEITINPGWNWIGFPSAQEMTIAEAFADFEAEFEDLIEGQDEEAVYFGEWMGFETLHPGQGYMYYSNSNEPKTLVIPSGAK